MPGYVGAAFEQAPPGHRFGLYFKVWDPRTWELPDGAKLRALDGVVTLQTDHARLMESLRTRQKWLAETLEDVAILEARTVAPFVTGLGLEHPVENGFSFLSPYGLPYLPGSGVKGVLRRAAEEVLLFGDAPPFTLLDFWWLFGFEASSAWFEPPGNVPDLVRELAQEWREAYAVQSKRAAADPELANFLRMVLPSREADRALGDPAGFLCKKPDLHFRGSLACWDVFPAVGKLDVEVLTPHFMDYYEGRTAPSDDGRPIPNSFLVVPPGAQFRFVVQFCGRAAVPERLRQGWRAWVDASFEAALERGFGAKTSVGYGQLQTVSTHLKPPWEART